MASSSSEDSSPLEVGVVQKTHLEVGVVQKTHLEVGVVQKTPKEDLIHLPLTPTEDAAASQNTTLDSILDRTLPTLVEE